MFIDRNGKLFAHVLDFLREGAQWQPPKDEYQLHRLQREFEYYGLPFGLPSDPHTQLIDEGFSSEMKSTHIQVVANGAVAYNNYSGEHYSHGFVLGKNLYKEGTIKFTLKVEALEDGVWMFFAILGDIRPNNDASWNKPSSYGWARPNVWIDGHCHVGYVSSFLV